MTEHSPDLSYTSYLPLGDILGAQHPRSEEHDEMLFIVIHQASSSWSVLPSAGTAG
jgi:tryptophan 2,3-dioxygenase